MGLRRPPLVLVAALLVAAAPFAACSGDDETGGTSFGGSAGVGGDAADDGASDATDASSPDAASDAEAAPEAEASTPCPADMVLVEGFCIDRYEAPNREGELPLVMYTFDEAEAWCASRSKRLCFDDEWTRSCEGTAKTKYPYGDVLIPGTCNDEETWLAYDQAKLNGWPWNVSKPSIESLWAESRTCQNAVLTHGNGFRFYEIGFRCCRDPSTGD